MYTVAITKVFGTTNIGVKNLVFDSRKTAQNSVFIALKGVLVDGHLYIATALDLGATVIVCEDFPLEKKRRNHIHSSGGYKSCTFNYGLKFL